MRKLLCYVRLGQRFDIAINGLIAAATAGVLSATAFGSAIAGERYGPEPYPRPAFEVPEARGYGRMFFVRHPDDRRSPGLPAQDSPFKALMALGRSMVEQGNPDDPRGDSELPSGYVYFGQFIDHDITFDVTTMTGHRIRSDAELVNGRTPDLDLDNLYGDGPMRSPHLYHLPYLRVGKRISDGGAPRYDLFRVPAGHYEGPRGGKPLALLGDPRDDENIVLAQLHAAFVAFHNRTVDILIDRYFGKDRGHYCKDKICDLRVLADGLPDDVKFKIFEKARDHVTHYYHRIILEDYLPRVIGDKRVANILANGRDFYYPAGFRDGHDQLREATIPVEFAGAVFRLGHSQVRDHYTLRKGVRVAIFGDEERDGILAFEPISPRYVIDWRYFFDIDPTPPPGFNYARRIDPLLTPKLQHLNMTGVVSEDAPGELASLDLMRGRVLHLPAGQDLAERMLPILQERNVLGRGQDSKPWQAYLLAPDGRVSHFLGNEGTPLWYYILQEAAIFGTRTDLQSIAMFDGDGRGDEGFRRRGPWRTAAYEDEERARWADGGHRLGPVGGTIVGEVLVGLLEHYQEKTSKGLAYRPEVYGGVSYFGTPDGRSEPKRRYLMRNLLMDAGVVDVN